MKDNVDLMEKKVKLEKLKSVTDGIENKFSGYLANYGFDNGKSSRRTEQEENLEKMLELNNCEKKLGAPCN